MLGSDLLEYIFKRLAPTGEAMFGYDEVKEWQPEFFSVLKAEGLLRKAQPQKDIECRGCEEYCFMPVEVYPALDSSRPARAFISCDKRDDIGRIPVEMVRLEQWQITDERLAHVLTKLLDLTSQPECRPQRQWMLGRCGAKYLKKEIVLYFEDTAYLKVGGHVAALADYLQFHAGQLSLNKDELQLLASKKVKSSQPLFREGHAFNH